jgi:hypothetical protein
VTVASATGIAAYTLGYAQGGPGAPSAAEATFLFVDKELMKVIAVSGTIIQVQRGVQGTKQAAHNSASTVWVGPGSWFIPATVMLGGQPTSACVAANSSHLPYIALWDGSFWACDAGSNWKKQTDSVYYVPPTSCTFGVTTLTTTNTYVPVGASNAFVLSATTNAAAGTLHLVCQFLLPTRIFPGRGATIWDVTAYYGSQTVAPTSVGTATLGTITFPAAAALTETASTVTPVAAGGTVTTVYPVTTSASVTTAGAFLTAKSTFSTAVTLNTDRQLVQYMLPFVQSAASAMTVNTPGIMVHYTAAPVE